MMEVKTLLEKIGLKTATITKDAHSLTVYQFLNPDGTVRWFWPVSSKHPHFLKFYNVQGWKSKLFAGLTRLVFTVNIQSVMFRKATYFVEGTTALGSSLTTGHDWAVFTGTPGPNRKAILFTDNGGVGSFTKISMGENSKNLIQNEVAAISFLKTTRHLSFRYPEVLADGPEYTTFSDLSAQTRRLGEFTATHEKCLMDIRNETRSILPLNHLDVWRETKEHLSSIKTIADSRIPKGLIRKLEMMVTEMDSDMYLDVTFSHGDFTPWNMFQDSRGNLTVYDWELAQNEIPFGFDAFHFIIQNGILTERKSWRELERQITESLFANSVLFARYSPTQQRMYLKLYLLINTVYYLTVYQQQTRWHRQVTWLINTWSEGITSLLATARKNRELVAMDVIDFALDKKYAILKYDNSLPEHLPEFSDIDICTSKAAYSKIARYLAQHVLVRQRRTYQKTFMATEQLVLHDGTFLSLDFIWEVKRKNLVIMDSASILANSVLLRSGVKVASALDNARYVGLFYSLNNAPVPEKYSHSYEPLDLSTEPEDMLISKYYKGHVKKELVFAHVKSLHANRGLNRIRHTINYLFDTVRTLMDTSGMIITFSGVDGAGKSTVIENLKFRIEKQLRKRVVIIRHRPSLLPILSAWTKGKTEAEKQAASKLPRQGTNENILSSLLRFSYYYLDYIFGQWYVAAKYGLRGYVVLYDRYYFDFINDSRRSNINLPSSITRLAYALIREPDINFFLYADPELILSRKQELDKSTIQSLTQRYLTLFRKLNGNRSVQRYVPIENVDLSQTLNLIMDKVTPAL
jgi:thymidylate kinase